jgi:outer membrane protein assembly factor BamB
MRAHNFITISILFLLIALMTVCAVADDWPNWRGPQHNGISNEINWGGDWAACEPNVLWEQQVGTGFSSIAVAEGRLYTMGNSNLVVDRVTIAHDMVYCLDPNTGEILWTHAYPSTLAPYLYEGGPSATPTIADSNVYTFSKQGMAYCLDANDGGVLWQSDVVADYGMRVPTYGFAGSPYVDANLVIYNAGTHGLALHAADGTLAWETGTNRSGYSTPVPFDFEEQPLLVLMGEKTFAAVQAQTGEVLWEHPWVTRYNANIPDPIVDSNLVFVSTGYQEGSALFDVATGQVTELWFQRNVQTWLNSSVLWQGYLYGPNDNGKTLTCVERDTGWIMWTRDGFGNGSVMLADGKLIALSEDGELWIAEASPAGYRGIGRGRILTGKCWSVPVLANGKIYARNAMGHLVCVELMPVEEILPIELIAYWKLDETEGDIAYDSAAAHDGVVIGDAVWQPTGGKVNGSLEFDGIDDYISTDFVLNPADSAFSVFAWTEGGAPGQVMISQIDGNGSGETWLGISVSNGNLMTGLVPPPVGRVPPQPLESESVIADGQWHHIGFVWDGSYRSLYVDGTEAAKDTEALTLAPLKYSDGGLYIGTSKTLDAGTFFSGLIDDVRIYNVALSAEEIEALAQ